jgi:alpha-galactosidase
VFSCNSLKPVTAKRLPGEVHALVLRNAVNIENLCRGIRAQDMRVIFEAFVNQPLCDGIAVEEARELFEKMCDNVRDEEFPF